MEPITLGMIALVQVLALAIVNQWGKSKDKKEDWRRQDEVAARVATAAQEVSARAELLLQAQKETIIRTDEVARIAAEADARINSQLQALDEQGRKIHTLVNSDMTAARTSERDQTKLLLIALKNVRHLVVKMGLKPTLEENRDIEDAEHRIVELEKILEERRLAQVKIDEKELAHKNEPIKVTIVNPTSDPVPVIPAETPAK